MSGPKMPIGSHAFRRQVDGEIRALLADAFASTDPVSNVGDLPAPVRRWLETSGAIAHERIRTVRLRQRGALHDLFTPTRAVVRYVLGALLAFGALNAFGGGYYGLAGAKDVPTDWLEGSPFSDYFIPSLILFVVVGGALLLAAIAVFARWRSARGIAGGAGVIVLGWLAVQLAIIGYVSWMQPITAIVALVVLALASRLAATGSRMRYGDHLRSW